MPSTAYIDQTALEKWFTADLVRRVFTDAKGGTLDRLEHSCVAASRKADALLMQNFSQEKVADMVAEDAALEHAICQIALSLGMQGKPEWYRPGDTFRTDLLKEGEKTLRDVAQAEKRSAAEETVQRNAIYDARITVEEPQFVFAPSGGRTQRGGF